MLIAADYPFMDVFWSMLIFFLWIAWLLILFRIFADIFRRHDISGWGKAAWCVFVIFLPFLGVLVYLIAEGKNMAQRDVDRSGRSTGRVRRLRQVGRRVAAAGTGASRLRASRPRPRHDAGVVDEGTEFGVRLARHLREEIVVWMTTVTPAGEPVPMPVWFFRTATSPCACTAGAARACATSRRTRMWR